MGGGSNRCTYAKSKKKIVIIQQKVALQKVLPDGVLENWFYVLKGVGGSLDRTQAAEFCGSCIG